jgi:hypothetical protein
MTTHRKRNRFPSAKRDGNSYTLKPEAESQHVAYRRSEKAMEARCDNCEIALR